MLNKTVRIVGINGSPFKRGRCAKLLERALRQSRREGAQTEIIHLANCPKVFFNGALTERTPTGMKWVFDQLLKADGFIFATPVHWFGMSDLMKNFFSRSLTVLECKGFKLEGKVASFIAVCDEDGGLKTIADMLGPLSHMGVGFPPCCMFYYNPHVAKHSMERWMTKVEMLGANIVEMAKRINHGGKYRWYYGRWCREWH